MILEGIRVVDLGRYIAGPLCGALLSDLGADVIRVERVSGGDDRFQYTTGESKDNGSLFLQMNRNKRSLTLSLGTSEGREVLQRLCATADVVVVNLPLEAVSEMGVDYESLCRLRPDIILVHATAFGSRGPYKDRVGFDGVGQVMSGSAFLSGPADRPSKSYAPWVDVTTALFSTYGALSALMHRDKTGEGQLVEADLLKSAMSVMNFCLMEQSIVQPNREATDNRIQSGGPGDIFKTKDGWVLIQVVGNPVFRRWAALVKEDAWPDDPRFNSDEKRAEHGELLSRRAAEWCETLTTQDAIAALAANNVPAAPVLSPQQILDDHHIHEANYFKYLEYPGVEKAIPFVFPIADMSKTKPKLYRRPPTIGEHTEEILAELGYSKEVIARMRDMRIA